MATTITTQSTTIKRIVHDPARNRVLLISASGVDIYRVTDWTRIAWASLANVTCGAFNDGGIYIGTSTSGVFRLPLAATGAATSQLVPVFVDGTAVALSSFDIKSIAGFGSALAIVTASEFVYLPNPATDYEGPTAATAVAMNGTYLVWATADSVEILDTLPTADFSSSDVSIGDTANHLAFEVGTNNLLICHEDGLRLVDCADPGGAGGLPTDGLQILWTMDAISGTSLLDDSGKGHNGTISGATQATGSIGKALDFDGSNDQVSIASHADFNHGGAFSISLRFKTSDSTNRQALFWKNPTGAAGFWCRLEPADNRIRAYVYDGTNGCMLATTQHYCDGAEHHLTAIFDGATSNLTIDGIVAATGDANAVGDWSNTDPIYIGRSAAAADWHAGWVDEFRFYNRSLTTNEITALEDQTDPTVPRAGLVAHYTMDAISGTSLLDETGTQNGTISGATQVAGEIGNALSFNGTSDAVTFGTSIDLRTNTTVALWVETEQIAGSSEQCLAAKVDNSTEKEFDILINDNGLIKLDREGSGNNWLLQTSTGVYSHGERNHIVVTIDTTTAKIYLNGTEVASGAISTAPVLSSNAFLLGMRGGSYNDFFMKGTVDDLRVLNRAISAEEVAGLYAEATNPMPRAGLVSHWTMDSINGTTLADEEGTQTGTISGATQVDGYSGKALSFDGTNDTVAIAQNSAHDFGTDDFSYAVWFKTTQTSRGDILENGYNGSGGKWSALYITSDIFCGSIDDGTNATWGSGSTNAWAVNDGEWHLGIVTYDRSGNLQRYIDGQAYGDPYSITAVGSVTDATNGITLGTRTGQSDYYEGQLEGFRIYSRVLSAAEIALLYLEGIGGFGTNYDGDLGTVVDCQDAMKAGDYVAYGTSNGSDGGRFGILELDTEGAATSKTTVASTDTDAVWIAAGATEAIYNNQLERYRLVADMSPGAGARSVRRDWALYAEITDSLGGIQSGTVTLKVNGVSKTSTTAAITDGYSVSYTPGSNSGYGERVTIEISGTDADGNTVSRSWAFTTASAPALTVTDASPPNVTCIRDIDLALAESDETVDSVNVIWIDTISSPLIVTEAQAKEVGRVAIDGQTYHRHQVGVKVLAADAGALQTRDLRQGGIATITCDALGMSAQKCEILAAQRVIDDGAEDISFNLQAAYYEEV